MGTFIGRLTDIGIAKESVRGTAVDAIFFVPQVNFNFDEQIQQVIDESSVGVIEDSIDANVTEQFTEGTLEARIQAETFGLFLLNAIGAVSSVVKGGETIVFEHTYSVKQDAQHPSLTISVKEPNSAKRYPLGMLTSLELNIALNAYAMMSAEIRSKKGEAASITPSYVTADEKEIFLAQHGELKFASDLAGLGAAPETKIRNLVLTIAKNVEDDQVIGSLDPADILNKQFSVEGTVELLYRDSSFVDDLLADTKKAARITLTNTDITIGVGSNPKIQIDLANVKFSEVTKPFTNNDLTIQTLAFKAMYSLADAKLIDVVLTNLTASY